MKEKFQQIPVALQKQILMHCGASGLSMILFFVILACTGDWRLFLPCAILSVTCFASAASLFDQCVQRKYVTIECICTQIEKTAIRKRIKTLYLREEKYSIKLIGAKPVKGLIIGDRVTVFVAENSAVYEMDGCQVICGCLAMTKEGITHENGSNLRSVGRNS